MRLIDADEFMKTVLRIKRLNEECQLSDIDLENEKINNYETGHRETFDLITENLDAQPTAYDPNKVVEQLEDLKSLVPVNRILDDIVNEKQKELGMLIDYRKAIEIVKGGGLDG